MDSLVVAMLNSAREDTDPFETPLGAARWWAEHGAAGSEPFPQVKPRFDSALASALRSIRAAADAILKNGGGSLPLAFRGDASDVILFRLKHAIATAFATGQMERVRSCCGRACGRYFLDQTKNGSRRWCSLRCMERARAPRRRTISR